MVQLYSILRQRNKFLYQLNKKPTFVVGFFLLWQMIFTFFLHNDRQQNVRVLIPAMQVHQ